MESYHGSTRPDRKTIERNRRIHMKALHAKLISLIPTEGVAVTQPDQLDEAIKYIKAMQGMLERMKKRKRQLMGSEVVTGLGLPKIEVQELSSGLRVIAISSSSDLRLQLGEVIRVLGAEGVEVITASYAVIGDKAFHTIQSLMASESTGNGEDGNKVLERSKKAIHA